jgi:hypothetical protein
VISIDLGTRSLRILIAGSFGSAARCYEVQMAVLFFEGGEDMMRFSCDNLFVRGYGDVCGSSSFGRRGYEDMQVAVLAWGSVDIFRWEFQLGMAKI